MYRPPASAGGVTGTTNRIAAVRQAPGARTPGLRHAGPAQSTVFADSIRGWTVSRTGVVQTYTRGQVTTVRGPDQLPTDLHVSNGYPNPLTPAHPEGTIPFDLSRASHVRASVRNAAGQEIATLVETWLQAGRYYAMWDSSDVPAGVYFYSIAAGSQVVTQRIAVLR